MMGKFVEFFLGVSSLLSFLSLYFVRRHDSISFLVVFQITFEGMCFHFDLPEFFLEEEVGSHALNGFKWPLILIEPFRKETLCEQIRKHRKQRMKNHKDKH